MAVVLNSENEAWQLLDDLVQGRRTIEKIDDIQFGDWFKSTLYIPEKRYDSALNANMMRGWVDAQLAIYRTYALVAYGQPNGRLLSDQEKDDLELVVKVKSGSSDQEADLVEIFKEVAVTAVDKMDSTTVAVVIVALALIWAGRSVWTTIVNNRKEIKQAEITSKAQIKALETIAAVSENDTEKWKLLEKAIEKAPIVAQLKGEADTALSSLAKHASSTDAVINGVNLRADAAQALTKTVRSSAVEERKDGDYLVRKVDTTVPNGFGVYVQNAQTGEAFQANVQEVMSSLEDRQIIRDAEWSKVPVRLTINAKVRKGEVIDALILRAEKFEQPEGLQPQP